MSTATGNDGKDVSVEKIVLGDATATLTRVLPGGRVCKRTVDGREPGVIPLRGTRVPIGRAESNRIIIPNTFLSRHHACLEYRTPPDSNIGKWYLNDTSANGIKVNTKTCPKFEWTELQNGDVIQILPSIQFRINYMPLRDSRVLVPSDQLEHFKRKCESLEIERIAERLVFETTLKELQTEKEYFCKSILEVIKAEFECCICSDVFIQATVLGCGHTFCDSCICEWFQRKYECPTCRKSTTAKSTHIELVNFLNKIYEIMPENVKRKRNSIVQERQTSNQTKMITVNGNRRNGSLNNLLMEFNNFILAFGNRGGTIQSVPAPNALGNRGVRRAGAVGFGNIMESPPRRLRPRLLLRRRTIRPQPRIPPPRGTLTDLEYREPANPVPDPPPQLTPDPEPANPIPDPPPQLTPDHEATPRI